MTTINANTGETIETARTYAEYLASYIRDPSTIRIRTLEQFGFAPDVGAIKEMRAKVESIHAMPWNSYQLPKYNGSRMDVWVEPKAVTSPSIPLPRQRPRPVNPDEIISQIASELGSSYAEVISRARPRRITRVRFLIAGLLVERGNSYSQTGMFLGGRDHKTAHSACGALRGILKRDPELMAVYTKYCALWGLNGRFAR